MKGGVSLRDLQSLGKSQQYLLIHGHFPMSDLYMRSEFHLAIQDERKVWGFQQRLALSFVCCFSSL